VTLRVGPRGADAAGMTKRTLVAIAAVLSIAAPAMLRGAHVDAVPTSRITNKVAAGQVKKIESKLPSYPLLTH
jgi:hypothetical protein